MQRRFGLWLFIPVAFAVQGHCAAAPIVDATGCLHVVKTGPSATCDAQSKSMKVELINTCKRSLRVQICLRGPNKLWADCATKDHLAANEHFFGASCNTTGDYTYWGCSDVSGKGACGGNDLVGKATNLSK